MTWEKVKLGEVLKHRKGSITISDDKEYKLCRVRLHRKGVVLREFRKGLEIRTKKQQVCKANDFIVAEMDAKVGGYGFVPEELNDAIVSSHYYLFELDETKIKKEFLEVICQTTILQEQIKATGSTNYAAIRPRDVLAWGINLPPLEKQIEIAKIILSTKDRVTEITTELSRQLEFVRQLRQAFLREAMQGQLAEQDAADEPAGVLLSRIKAEKEKLVAQKKIKRDKPLPAMTAEEIPFEIPSTWTWCRLGEVCEKIGSGSTPRGSNYSKLGVPFFRSQNIYNGGLILSDITYISEEVHKKMDGTKVIANDILLNITGGSLVNLHGRL